MPSVSLKKYNEMCYPDKLIDLYYLEAMFLRAELRLYQVSLCQLLT